MSKVKFILCISILFFSACSSLGNSDTITTTQTDDETSSSGNVPNTPRPTEQVDNAGLEPLPTTTLPLREIPGITETYMWELLQDRGFACEKTDETERLLFSECTQETPEYSYKVVIYVRKANTNNNVSPVEHIKASVTDTRKQPEGYRIDPSDEAVVSFLGFIAALPYDNAEPEVARRWVENALDNYSEYSDKLESFAGVPYVITSYPKSVILDMGRL